MNIQPIRLHSLAAMIAVALLLGSIIPAFTPAQDKTTVVFTHVNVIPMDREVVLEDMNVVVSDGKIAALGRAADVRIPAGAKVIDSRGKFLIPGLMDMHTHMGTDQYAPLYLAYGITRVRNMSQSEDGDHYNRRRRIADGTITGPVVYSSGPIMVSNNPAYAFNVSSAEQGRELVRKSKADGADWIKTARMDMDIFHAILDEARKQGLPVGGHLPSLSAPILEIYRSGFRSHEHVTEVFTSESFFNISPDETKLKAVAQQIKETGIIISTILHREMTWKRMREEGDAYLTDARVAELQRFTGEKGVKAAREFLENLKKEDEKARERTGKILGNIPFILKIVKALNDAGVPLVIGTDSHFYFSFAGLSLHDELDLLLEAGLTRYEALRVATYNAALLLDALDKLGTISVGIEADLVLVNSNPLTDIKTLRRPAGVMKQGRWFDRKELDALLTGTNSKIIEGKSAQTAGQEDPSLNVVYDNFYPTWSPDGSKIAFTSTRDGNREIYVINTDGSQEIRLTSNPASDWVPAWSPDGSKIAFVSDRDGNLEIYVMSADGSKQTRLTDNTAADVRPSWSPDSSRIVFNSNRDGHNEIYVMNADGTDPIRLTKTSAHSDWAWWSSDGSKILFETVRDGQWEVYSMNPDGSNQTRLTFNTASAPALSPDGSLLAMHTTRGRDIFDIYVVNRDGTGEKQLTKNETYDGLPTWSPDSSKIAFTSSRNGNDEIYVMNRDGSNQTRLTHQPSGAINILGLIVSGDVGQAVRSYRKIRKSYPERMLFREGRMNSLGELLLSKGRIKDAIEVYKLNVDSYPKSANAYDDLAEAYLKSGDKKLAIKNYEQSLKLNPKNQNAGDMLKKLKGGSK
ncbi:MAG: LpqB family beta-propeller domain-containing protein [Blastocatellia bacterium]|nr:LpqB family beta-propeller domain-containing protein [Blastocatellia bacterium]